MTAILRKLHTAAHLLAAPGGLRKAADASGKNLRRLNILCHRGRAFRYITGSNGRRFVCIPTSATSVHHYLSTPCYEEVELDLCCQWLRPSDACLDIGANIGLMTASFATFVGSTGLVVSVEPAPATHAFLRQGMQLLGHHNVRTEAVCVADHSGPVPFMVATNQSSDVEASMRIHASQSGQFAEVMIPAVTIDSLVDKHGIADRCSLVKIDIEGAEPIALRSASQLFGRDRLPLFIVEVQKWSLANFGLKPLDVLHFFPGDLFELFHVQRSYSDLTPQFEHGRLYTLPDPMAHNWPWYSNLIAVPRVGRYVNRRSAITNFLNPPGRVHTEADRS